LLSLREITRRVEITMLDFLGPKTEGFGLDINDLSIKIAQLKRKMGGFTLTTFGRHEIKDGLIEEGEIKKESELIDVIKEAIKRTQGEPLKTNCCITSLPETESFVQVVTLPLMKKEEVAEAIKWEIEAHIPLALNEVYYDWQIIEAAPDKKPAAKELTQPSSHLKILIGALPKKTVDPYLNVLKKAGLKPLSFEIECVAIARALIKKGALHKPIVIVDVGARRTNLLICCDQTIYFTTSLLISNLSLEKTLSEKLDITQIKAKEIKMKVGLDPKHRDGKIFRALGEPLKELAAKIGNYTDFYHDHILPEQPRGERIEKIMLCGGGANMLGLSEFLNTELKMPVQIGNPWINIFNNPEEASPGLPFDESLSFVTALGLALENYDQA